MLSDEELKQAEQKNGHLIEEQTQSLEMLKKMRDEMKDLKEKLQKENSDENRKTIEAELKAVMDSYKY